MESLSQGFDDEVNNMESLSQGFDDKVNKTFEGFTICRSWNGNVKSFLEQSHWSQNNSFLGPSFQLEHPYCSISRHKETPRNDIWQHDSRSLIMCGYSALFMRFAWMVQPRNLHLLVCHASNETVQLYQLSRWIKAQERKRKLRHKTAKITSI
ncbi:mitochondrial pyruvate carrier 1-like isoform X2 [Durio zibethinus]|uniref:Mitochondrial pyruvate carrier n=1 Tax=Durio zibethinus TaxID=66656 RepID=A0A6P5YJ10_DURZI|nr:mitochondrial pyruvate carrier 1-like isoform X2 [Durio zibethinus]